MADMPMTKFDTSYSTKVKAYISAIQQSWAHYLLAYIIPTHTINRGFCMQHQMRELRLPPGLTPCPLSCLII